MNCLLFFFIFLLRGWFFLFPFEILYLGIRNPTGFPNSFFTKSAFKWHLNQHCYVIYIVKRTQTKESLLLFVANRLYSSFWFGTSAKLSPKQFFFTGIQWFIKTLDRCSTNQSYLFFTESNLEISLDSLTISGVLDGHLEPVEEDFAEIMASLSKGGIDVPHCCIFVHQSNEDLVDWIIIQDEKINKSLVENYVSPWHCSFSCWSDCCCRSGEFRFAESLNCRGSFTSLRKAIEMFQ